MKTAHSVIYDTLTTYAQENEAVSLRHAQIRDWITDLILNALEEADMLEESPISDPDKEN